jgi:dihydrofolate synthase/folylpolyglutamate synthase
VLVGGTNGKGSVTVLLSAALREAGYRVGESTKPHLVDYRECLVVDGCMVSETTFASLLERTLSVARRVAPGVGEPTEFELLTAAMFTHFAEAAVDLALVEVGLGGRLDATNAWDGGVAAITNVALDHTDRLGSTVCAIAAEKAPIIKRADLAVTGASGEALAVIRRHARLVGASLVEAVPAWLLGMDRDGITVELPGLGPTWVGLRGRHQAANVAVANEILDALEIAGMASVSREHRRRGLARTAGTVRDWRAGRTAHAA